MNKDLDKLPRITKLWAKNYRSVEDMQLELSPLTVLVGPNASGKSNVVDVLRFVSDAFNRGLEAAIASRHGIGAIRRWSAKGRPYDVEIGLQIDGDEFKVNYDFILGSKLKSEYRVKRESCRVELDDRLENPFEFEIRDGELVESSVNWPGGGQRQFDFHSLAAESVGPMSLGYSFFRRMLFVSLRRRRPTDDMVRVHRALRMIETHLCSMRFYHIFPNALREPQKFSEVYHLSEHGENLASVLRVIAKGAGPSFSDLRDALGKVVPGVRDLRVTPVGGYLVVKLRHEGTTVKEPGAWFDLSQESDGTLRLLALLVAIFQSPPPPFIAIEEPELTVHPGALTVLADFLQQATLRTQILITTHSPDLIDRLPIDSVRAIQMDHGVTTAGKVADHQKRAVLEGLFSPGELHRMEGLQTMGDKG